VSITDESGKARATIREIASAAGVSIATVSRVLNERPGVAAETRDSVLRVVRDHGFSANRSARALSGGRTGLIGVMLPMVGSPYFAAILSGAAEALYEQDMRMVMCPTLHHHEREVTLLDRLMHGTTDGAVLMLPEESNAELKVLRRKGYAFVIVDPRVTLDEGIPAVSAANASGARAATEHLLSLGHRRVAHVAGASDLGISNERTAGYRDAHAAAGLEADPSLLAVGSFTEEGGYEATRTLLARTKLSAVFAANDLSAIGVINALAESGRRVPDDVSVVGFDNVRLARFTTPPLTTIAQPAVEIAERATKLLLDLANGRKVGQLRHLLEPELVVRRSTAPPP
jgi:DNA-binding LacI/PurR family transcriptional regulator